MTVRAGLIKKLSSPPMCLEMRESDPRAPTEVRFWLLSEEEAVLVREMLGVSEEQPPLFPVDVFRFRATGRKGGTEL